MSKIQNMGSSFLADLSQTQQIKFILLNLQKAILCRQRNWSKTKTDRENNLHFKGNKTRDKIFPKTPHALSEIIRIYNTVKGKLHRKLMTKWWMIFTRRGKSQWLHRLASQEFTSSFSDLAHEPIPFLLKVKEVLDSQYTTAGQQLSLEFLMVSVEGRKWNRRSGKRSQSWDGAVGRSCLGYVLNFFHWNAT